MAENPYFRFKQFPCSDLTRSETNPSHKDYIDRLINLLTEAKSLRIYTNEFLDNYPIESSLINLDQNDYSKYKWGKEVFKRVNNNNNKHFSLFKFAGICENYFYY